MSPNVGAILKKWVQVQKVWEPLPYGIVKLLPYGIVKQFNKIVAMISVNGIHNPKDQKIPQQKPCSCILLFLPLKLPMIKYLAKSVSCAAVAHKKSTLHLLSSH